MQISPEQLEAAILQLPAHVRARLAEVLIQSLDEAAELDVAWADEADRRFPAAGSRALCRSLAHGVSLAGSMKQNGN